MLSCTECCLIDIEKTDLAIFGLVHFVGGKTACKQKLQMS